MKNSRLKRTDGFFKHIVTYTANQLEVDDITTKGNQKHAKSTYNDYKKTIKLSRIETKV